MREAGELCPRVTCGDPVAVGIGDVVQLPVGSEGGGQAIQLAQSEAASEAGREDAVIANLGEVLTASAVGLEAAARSVRADDGDRAIGILLQTRLPRHRPTVAQRTNLTPADNRIGERAPDAERQARRHDGGVNGCGQGPDRADAVGLLQFKRPQLLDVEDRFTETSQVLRRYRPACGRSRPTWFPFAP